MLSDTMDSSTTNHPSEVLDRVHAIYIRLPYYMVPNSIGTCSSFTGAKTIILDTGSGHILNRFLALPISWQRHVCSDFEIPPVGNANRNFYKFYEPSSYVYGLEAMSTELSFRFLTILA